MSRISRRTSLALSLLMVPAALSSQNGAIAGVVTSRETKEPLAYTIIAVPALGRELFSNDSGRFTLGGLPSGPLHLTIRRLGYGPSDITVEVRAGMDSIRIELSRTAVALSAVLVRAFPTCSNPGPPSERDGLSLVTVFSQLRMNADQYRLLSEEYPFESFMDVLRARKEQGTDTIRPMHRETLRVRSKSKWHYGPGKIVTGRWRQYTFNIPTLVDFADERFLAEHCFHYAGFDTVEARRMVRLDFLAADRIKAPDVNGSLYMDPETFQIRRSVLRLTKLPDLRALSGYEVTTDFAEVMPSVPIISQIFSVQSYDTTALRDQDAIYEVWRLQRVNFVGKKPGQEMIRTP